MSCDSPGRLRGLERPRRIRIGYLTVLSILTWLPGVPPGLAEGRDVVDGPRRIREELSQPFCYFLFPSDEIGFKDCPEGTQVTHDGAYVTGFGEFDLLAGFPPRPIATRIKTLEEGFLPIVSSSFSRDGCRYEVESFAAPLDLDPRRNLIQFVTVTLENTTPIPLRVGIGGQFVDAHGKGRESLGCPHWYRDRSMDFSIFSAGSFSTTKDGSGIRGNHVLFTSRADSPFSLKPTPNDEAKVNFFADLAPGRRATVTFRFPYVPIHREHESLFADFLGARSDDYRNRVREFWKELLGNAASFEVPERKAVDTAKASLVYDLIARDIDENRDHYVQKVSDIHYDAFWVRDGAFIVRGYDLLGLHDIARETIQHFLLFDEKGNVKSFRGHQPDSWGQSLWTVGAHARITGDLDFARRVYPAVPPHVAAFERLTSKDPLGLWPVSPPYDNEAIEGHYTGHNFWALLGLREAIDLAAMTGHREDARRYQQIRAAYEEKVLTALEAMTSQTEGYIPPGLDDPLAGFDWANASGGLYPFNLFEPDHPWARATLRTTREWKYREGIMTYGPNAWSVKQRAALGQFAPPGALHHYETMYITQGLIQQGAQREVLEDFYSILVHTGSTQSGFEWGIPPWSTRDPGGNYPPHGWFAARYNALFRNMLIREEGDHLHLTSALSPAWIRPGEQIRVRKAPTDFGPLTYSLEVDPKGAVLRLSPAFRNPPKSIVLHIPFFVDVQEVIVDGKPQAARRSGVSLLPSTKEVRIRWTLRPNTPDLSFNTGVKNFLKKHWTPEPADDPGFLFPRPSRPRVLTERRLFLDEIEVTIAAPPPSSRIHYTTDGTEPSAKSPILTRPLRIDSTTTIRALSVLSDLRSSEPISVTFEKTTPRPPDTVGSLGPGLFVETYRGKWSVLPEFDRLSPFKSGFCTSFDPAVVTKIQDDFALRFRGYLEVPRTGIYTFATVSDDGSQLEIGEDVVVDNDGLHPRHEERGSIGLEKGHHLLTVTFFERAGAENLTIKWQGPGIPEGEIPFDRLVSPRPERR